jgi:hypothetical protein
MRDPSLRSTEQGRILLRLMQTNTMAAEQLHAVARAVPPHCLGIVAQLARCYVQMWDDLARELDGRSSITDPTAKTR